MASNRLDWLLFVALGFFWGSSYLFIKIGVESGLEPFTLVAARLFIGFLILAAVVLIARQPLPRRPRTYGHLLVLSVFSVSLPFSLITWAEQSVDSAVAAILTAPAPLFVMIIAAFVLQDERITLNRIIGLVLGFVGVAVLVGFDPTDLQGGTLIAELALLGAALCYAIGGVYARKMLHGLRPMIPAVMQVTLALATTAVLAFIFERPLETRPGLDAIFALLWLGVLGSGLAYLIFFRLLERWGATRTSTVAYVLPVFGIALGALVLAEPIDVRLLIGTALVILGIALVNARRGLLRAMRRRLRRRPNPSVPSEPR